MKFIMTASDFNSLCSLKSFLIENTINVFTAKRISNTTRPDKNSEIAIIFFLSYLSARYPPKLPKKNKGALCTTRTSEVIKGFSVSS